MTTAEQGENLDLTRAYGLDFLFPTLDMVVGRLLADHGEFARIELDVICAILSAAEPGTYLDVGANIGSIALPVAAANPAFSVVAIEANRRIAMILAANALLNRLDNVDVIHAAAGQRPGLASFPVPLLQTAMNFGDVNINLPGHPRENVRVCTIDEVVPAGSTRVVKIDVQGFERQVVAGGERLLREDRPIWLLETQQDQATVELLQTFLDADYDLYWMFSPFITPRAAKGMKRTDTVDGDTSVVAVPRGKSAPIEMPQVRTAGDRRPGKVTDYPYLRAYGFGKL